MLEICNLEGFGSFLSSFCSKLERFFLVYGSYLAGVTLVFVAKGDVKMMSVGFCFVEPVEGFGRWGHRLAMVCLNSIN